MPVSGRKTEKQRRAFVLRFSPDPSLAREQRDAVNAAFKRSGYRFMNDFLVNTVLEAIGDTNGRPNRKPHRSPADQARP